VAVQKAKPSLVQRYLPILHWLPTYQRDWLAPDAVAALSVWALLVPQSLGYATLAGVPVQYGLYTAFVALIAYAIFGTSRHMVQGPSGAVAAVSAAVIGPIVGTAALGSDKAVGYTAALALATGAVYLALGLLRMGWISNFLSKAVLGGFVVGFAIGIIIDQSHKLLGVDKVSGSYVHELVGTIKELPDTNLLTLAVGAGSLAALLLMRRYLKRWPRALIVMALSILAVQALDLADQGVAVTGDVPTGLFSIGFPGVGWGELGALVVGALSVAFVGYSESLASARAMALKHHYQIDPDQELIAQGAACGAAGFVGGFATDGSLSKTSVADVAGQQTQMASLINAVFVLLTMLLLASLFENLPAATLGAVVIDAMLGMVTFGPMRRYWRVNRADWVFYLGAMLGILFIDIIHGILIGVVLSLLLLIDRASKPGMRRLGRDPKADVWVHIERYPGLETVPGVLAVRVDGPLFFADANRFRDTLNELIKDNPEPVRAVVVDATAISQTDTDGADIVIQIAEDLRSRGISLAVAHLEHSILELWTRAGAIDAIGGPDRVFETVREAVHALQASPATTTPATSSPRMGAVAPGGANR
jgi:high affinity sulfate transporter 1